MHNDLEFLNNLDWINHDGINLPMINDFMRNQFYDTILRYNVKDRHCLDIGFGTGLLSILALGHGAKSIVAYESDPDRYRLGCEIIKQMGLENKITLMHQRYRYSDFEKHNAEIVFTETVNGELWNEGLWQSLPRQPGIQFLPGIYYLDIVAVEISRSFATELIQEVRREQYFAPGIDIDARFIECVNSFSKTINSNAVPCRDGITKISNIDTVWGWMPYMRLAQYNGKPIAGYAVDAVENTITVTDKSGTRTSAIDFKNNQFTLDIDTTGWQDRCLLLVPRVGMRHGDASLILDTGHWGPVPNPVVIKNIKNNIKIVHNIHNGYIDYN